MSLDDSHSDAPSQADAPDLELLAPAGNWDCARAAVENGANAIYFGLDCGFNARARAANFDREDLPDLMEFLHRRGVRGYVTLNTLVFTSELAELEDVIRGVARAGVDAVLTQDLGAARLIRAICPELPIHASTQMTLTSAPCIETVADLGIERVVLPRELSISEISQIHRETNVPLEAFVHGALCVAYSGQCLTSESLGGRSANRGQCAQACRLPYELICDGQDVDLGRVQYLLSPQDLAAYDLVPDLIDAGVRCFKIEGRLKTPEYVANITQHYRRAIEAAVAQRPAVFGRRDVREMELSFSRGFSPGWLQGCDHKMLVPGLSSAKRGVLLGAVQRIRGDRVQVQLASPVAAGDGIVFESERGREDEQGGRVYHVFCHDQRVEEPVASGLVELAFQRRAIDLTQLRPGQNIWKTDDPKLTQRLRKTFTGPDPRQRVPLDLHVSAAVGQPLILEARATSGASCRIESEHRLEAALKHPLTVDLLRKQLGRLGGSAYTLRDLEATIDGGPMAPLSVLGKLRRALIEHLDESIRRSTPRQIADSNALDALRAALPKQTRLKSHAGPQSHAGPLSPADESNAAPVLRVLCRDLPQLQAAIDCGVSSVMVDLQDIRQFGDAVRTARRAGVEILLATPRIQKPGEMGIFRSMAHHEPDGFLVRNLAGLSFFRNLTSSSEHTGSGDEAAGRGYLVVADFSLNTANELTAQYLRERGAQRVTACYDLNREQLLDLVAAVPSDWLEVVVHQHMPMFHMEHCVFCAVLSPGTDKTNCGRPCDDHLVQLRDRVGMEHPLKADVGCRNTLFNAVPQSAAEAVPGLLLRGVRHFRIELLDDPAERVAGIVELYRALLEGRMRGKQVWTQLNAMNRVGVTRGTLEERRNPLAIL